jgi:hypothetical protein
MIKDDLSIRQHPEQSNRFERQAAIILVWTLIPAAISYSVKI